MSVCHLFATYEKQTNGAGASVAQRTQLGDGRALAGDNRAMDVDDNCDLERMLALYTAMPAPRPASSH